MQPPLDELSDGLSTWIDVQAGGNAGDDSGN
jgi:hypothetical protein